MKSLEKFGNVYQCQAKVVNSGRINVLENVIGVHIGNRNNFDVESLHVVHQNLHRIPANLHQFFPNLIRIYLGNSNLKSLTADDLKHFGSLKVLDVWNNKLTSLPDDLFKFTPKLQRIFFAKNTLQHIGEGLLDGLKDLQHADFRHNHCINFWAQTVLEIQKLKHQLLVKCSDELEISDEPVENFIEVSNENLLEIVTKLHLEMNELKTSLAAQTETIILMAKEVLEHKEMLESQAKNFTALVSEAAALVVQVVDAVVEESQLIENVEDLLEEQDEAIVKCEERLSEIETRLGLNVE